MLIIAVFVIPTRTESPTREIPQDLSFVYAVQIQEEPFSPSLASLIGDEYLVSAYVSEGPTEAITEVETELLVVVPENQTPIKSPCPISGQCVAFAKEMGIDVSGNAWDIKPNLKDPEVSAGILLYGHIAVITKIESESMEVIEQNFLGCSIISTRRVNFDDPSIRGFVK